MAAQLADRWGVPVGSGDEKAVRLLDVAVEHLVALGGDPLADVQAAVAADGDLVLGHCLEAVIHLYAMTREENEHANRILAGVGDSLPAGGPAPREREHLSAARAWAAGDLAGACRAFEQALLLNPADLLALKLAQDLYFFRGERINLRDVVARVLPAWPDGKSGAGYVQGMYAFGLEECGDYRAAERAGRTALAASPLDVWAVHAVAHVMEMEGRQREGVDFLVGNAADWSPSFFAVHNWWHRALYHLDLLELGEADALYDGPIRGWHSRLMLDLVDAASLLWRFSLFGIDVRGRAAELREIFEPHIDEAIYCFNDWHATMAFALDGRIDLCELMLKEIAYRSTGTNRQMVDAAGLEVLQGFLAFATGMHAQACELLGDVRTRAHVLGGSHAQRDVIDLTLLASAAASGNEPLVRALVAERVARKPTAGAAAERLVEVNSARAG